MKNTIEKVLFAYAMKLQLEVITDGRGNRAMRRGWTDLERIETGKRLDELGRKQERAACERLELIETI